MIVALAGRRIDAAEAKLPRFPPQHADRVEREIRSRLKSRNAQALVCAAACGADLLALEAAGQLGIRRRIVLPSDPDRFRAGSVVDRKDSTRDWGKIYDQVLAEVQHRGDLVILHHEDGDQAAYLGANIAILEEAAILARDTHQAVLAIAVWNMVSRGPGDVTAAFLDNAASQHIPVEEIGTL